MTGEDLVWMDGRLSSLLALIVHCNLLTWCMAIQNSSVQPSCNETTLHIRAVTEIPPNGKLQSV